MNLLRREQIGRAFSAARDYDRHARVQREVAQRLAAEIAALPLPPAPRILEIGCGTGFLTEALIGHGLGGEWLVSDISPEMIGRCRRRIGDRNGLRFAVLDGEYGKPEGAGSFDLVCSSLVMQWFDDHEAALSRMLGWLAPGGRCVFATLGAESFAEWRAAHEAEGFASGTPSFPGVGDLAAMLPRAQCRPHRIERLVETHDGALAFMRSLKAIGAHTAAQRHRPLDPAAMRRVMRNFEETGATVTYEVVACHYRRP